MSGAMLGQCALSDLDKCNSGGNTIAVCRRVKRVEVGLAHDEGRSVNIHHVIDQITDSAEQRILVSLN